MTLRVLSRLVLASAAMSAVSGCGGGGTPTPSPTPTPVSTAPRITSSAAANTVENATGPFYNATASDPQGDEITWDIYSGEDAYLFTITGSGALSFQEPPNYDLPADADGDNVYKVVIRATAGGETATLALGVTVENDREGIRVTRIATGVVDPVGMAPTYDGLEFVIAERDGRLLLIDGETGSLSEIPGLAALVSPGEVLAVRYNSSNSAYSDGYMLLTHSPAEGLLLQAFTLENGRTAKRQLAAPWSQPVRAALFSARDPQGAAIAAIGDPSGTLAQDATSGYGKLFEIRAGDPYAGASLPGGLVFSISMIGDGVQDPAGGEIFFDQTMLVDRGSTTEHEITLFNILARPLDFGWPYYEGTQAVRSTPPLAVNGPTLVYPYGDGPKEGAGIVAGVGYAGSISGIQGHYVFGDESGAIFSIPTQQLDDGYLHRANDIELRTDDFVPDEGEIDSPVAFAIAFQTVFILDADGEVFRVDSE